MPAKRRHEGQIRERLQRIIETCRSIEERSLDPFLIDVDENIKTLKECFPEWEIPEDLCLDARTLNWLASTVKLQSEWVKHRSTSLYTDPFLLEEKLKGMKKIEIISIFGKVWHPTVELEQISLYSLSEALTYWESLVPIEERWKENSPCETRSGNTSREELVRLRIMRDKAFSEELESFWEELKSHVSERGKKGKIRYWDFVGASSYEDTVDRAFLTSFLLTYGYATLEIHPLEEEMFIIPYEKPVLRTSKNQLVSIPIGVSPEDWLAWKKGNTI